MTIDDYAAWASANARRHDLEPARRDQLAYLGLGLAGETGEVVELIKKYLRDDRWPAERVSDELGDVAYYWACLCLANGRKPSEILAESIAKIEAKKRAADPSAQVEPS